jgi:beta-galactosidase
VKLYLNNQLIGEQPTKEMKAVFTVNYQPGTLRAEAGSDRKELQTAGAPARLRLTADRQQPTADGQPLLFITIEVVDSEGRIVPEAQQPLEVKVTGGSLLGLGNANPRDNDPYYDTKHSTWNGRALAVIKPAKKGKTVVEVNGERYRY